MVTCPRCGRDLRYCRHGRAEMPAVGADQCEECEREATTVTIGGVGLCDIHSHKASDKGAEK